MRRSKAAQTDRFVVRGAKRVPSNRACLLRRPGCPNLAIRLRNVTALGFGFECAEPIEIGSLVMLAVAGFDDVPAVIAWQLGTSGGARFAADSTPLATRERLAAALGDES